MKKQFNFSKVATAALLIGALVFSAGCSDLNEPESRRRKKDNEITETVETTRETESQETWKGSEEAQEYADVYFALLSDDWYAPELEDIAGSSWSWEGELELNRYGSYFLMFNEETVDVRWNDGYDESDHIYKDADLKLTEEYGFAVIELDFHEMAGKLYFNVLIDKDGEELFFMPDVSTGEVRNDAEVIADYLTNCTAPDPMELDGRWDRYMTEVEGYVEETPSGRVTIEITGDSLTELRITYTDSDSSGRSYSDKILKVDYGQVHYNCGNDVWLASVDYVGQYDTSYTITLRNDGTLMLQNFFLIDGAPMVSYEYFKRAE